jgi:hypothetical protein
VEPGGIEDGEETYFEEENIPLLKGHGAKEEGGGGGGGGGEEVGRRGERLGE